MESGLTLAFKRAFRKAVARGDWQLADRLYDLYAVLMYRVTA